MVAFGDYTEPSYRRPRPPRARPSFENLGYLRRLYPYFIRYRSYLIAAVTGILIARLLEALVPLLMKEAIDSLVVGPPNLLWPALGIGAVVIGRFVIFVFSRRLVRRIAIATAYDLRKRVFRDLYDSQLKEFTADKKRAEELLKFGEAKRDESVDPARHAAWTTVASAILNLDEVLTKE